ncbi:MAG: DNA mismatch repair protein MutS [Deltaproteobacteria bacterium]|nr:MAG: DNA mismatch repair protein MutS [Deltaproteobacteria bacterium]
MQNLTPIRQQYLEIKKRYSDMIVLFQIGDFFETFDEDAEIVSRELGIALTSKRLGKNIRVPLAGIPVHTLEQYIGKLIDRGYKVAVCEQLTPPGKKLIKRDVTRIITPGTVIELNLLDGKTNNYLASVVLEGSKAGMAYADITTGEFLTTELSSDKVVLELGRLKPSELLLPRSVSIKDLEFVTGFKGVITLLDDTVFEPEGCRRALLDHFKTESLVPYGCEHLPLAVRAAGTIVQYLDQIQRRVLDQLTRLSVYSTDSFMEIDPKTLANLEVFHGSTGTHYGSLISIIDLTSTPMGGRLLRKWLRQPLLDVNEIEKRQEVVQFFYENPILRKRLGELIGRIFDIERLVGRVKAGVVTPREIVVLGRSLGVVSEIVGLIKDKEPLKEFICSGLDTCEDIARLISTAVVDEPPASLEQGGVIRNGYSKELDQLRLLLKNSKKYMADLETRERERTGIKSLKVGYNKVFGYYIEVTKPNLPLVPPEYIRKQTLVNAERFVTLELKEFESIISNAQERIKELETSLFQRICMKIGEQRERVIRIASVIAHVDVFLALAEVAVRNNYIRPRLNNGDSIIIKGGRHPVVEHTVRNGEFVPNDTFLSNDENQIIIITAPNSSGKSTYLRQVALIVLLAQIGSFVPADSATIGIVDRIFTRVGLQEHIALGQSSFMLEMMETAHILNNATPRSLIILDEVGRGTSTYDGISISRAIIEFLHEYPNIRAKTLFATHYHELTELEDVLPRVKNFHMEVLEKEDGFVFLRRLVPGRAKRSYGVHIARLAGLPRPVVVRARQLLSEYEKNRGNKDSLIFSEDMKKLEVPPFKDTYDDSYRMRSGVLEELMQLNINTMTPVEALVKLYELQKKLSG